MSNADAHAQQLRAVAAHITRGHRRFTGPRSRTGSPATEIALDLASARQGRPPPSPRCREGSGDEGIGLIGELVELDGVIRCLLLTGDHDADRDLAAIRAGARGSLPRADVLGSDITRILPAAMDDELICARSTTSPILDTLVTAPAIGRGYRPIRSPLTRRERETLDLLCASHSTDRIAADGRHRGRGPHAGEEHQAGRALASRARGPGGRAPPGRLSRRRSPRRAGTPR